jgi:hypothetical protein
MKVLVACHCKKPFKSVDIINGVKWINNNMSNTVYFIDNKNKTVNPPDVELNYIDKHLQCPEYGTPNQYNEWDSIIEKFDLIWLEHCPMYGTFEKFNNIIKSAIPKLKKTGIIATNINFLTSKIKIFCQQFARQNKQFNYDFIQVNDMPYFISTYPNSNPQKYKNQMCLVIRHTETKNKSKSKSKSKSQTKSKSQSKSQTKSQIKPNRIKSRRQT